MSRKSKKKPVWLYLSLAILLAVLVLALLIPSERQGPAVQHTAVIEDGAGQATSRRIHDFAFEELDERQGMRAPVETPPTHNGNPETGIALIIDDVGYDLAALERVLALPFPAAISVLPDSPHAYEAAQQAHARGHMVMLHLPMEPASPKYQAKMGPSFLRAGMDQFQIQSLFTTALQQVPYVIGVNNHMGSLLTTQEEPMRWVMEICRKLDLFFIDSKTSGSSLAADVASREGVVWASRRVFLDHTVAAEDLQKAWNSARKCAQAGESCIVIAHPHAETLDFLEQHVSEADRQLIKPVTSMLHSGGGG